MTLQNKVIAGVIAFAEHLLESELRSDISQLVRYSGYSHRHLQRLFRNKTGMSVGDYIRRRRLTRAAILVRQIGYPLHDIAISVGFDSRPSLVADMTEKQKRLFKEYGVTGTPSTYVNGRYHIENGAFQADSVEAFRKSYVAAVMLLLNRKDK
ncbi:helix-turn-helix domain-containing protein [Escherichia marmotae]|uniref:Helix-turn-helix domain-containing protein n=2 Tax=Escherichia marmotae TaxID=1499973 RepID=A0ABU1C7H4_9ESCH|nr:helix-turn-helix domain-containing protein [Escherichia marmotae]MDQ9243983.1 helix-turn-helix domain-containing protein [Escherichia marmotae]MDQ9296596.1 helix-turn-helix domain-containing protein [Escherichia marmotae]